MIIDYFDRGAMLAGDGPCLTNAADGRTWTYPQVRELTLRAANGLAREGVGLGCRGAVLSGNDALAFVATLGLMRAGTAWIPLNPRFSIEDNGAILERFDCDVLFYHGAYRDSIARLRELAPRIRLFVCIDGPAGGHPGFEEWASGYPDDEVDIPFDRDAVIGIQPTGGTTGRPKGVMLTHQSFEYLVGNYLAVAPFEGRPRYLAAAPLTHAAGFVMQHILAQGGHAVVLPGADPGGILSAIPRYRITHLTVVPTILYMMLAHPEVRSHDYGSLRYCFYGGAPTAPEKLREAIGVFGPVMMQILGQTEASMPITCLAPADHLDGDRPASDERLMSCGRAAPLCRIAAMDDEGRLLPPGEVGELVIRSSGVMKGYYKDPHATEAAFTHGWLRSGDLVKIDAQGFVTIVDRKKAMIITGGFHVSSVEVEAAVMAHPAVQDCAVIGIPDDVWGESILAVVELRPGAAVEPEHLIRFCRARIGAMKSPRRIEFVETLPRSAVGKLLKRTLREQYWQRHRRAV